MSGINFEEVIQDAKNSVLVQFKTGDCELCAQVSSMVEGIAQEYKGKVKVVGIDARQYPRLYNEYEVASLPAVILFDKGKEVARVTGYNPSKTASRIKQMIEDGITPKSV